MDNADPNDQMNAVSPTDMNDHSTNESVLTMKNKINK